MFSGGWERGRSVSGRLTRGTEKAILMKTISHHGDGFILDERQKTLIIQSLNYKEGAEKVLYGLKIEP